MALLDDIYGWARQALQASSDDVPDASLSLLAASEQRQAGSDYPCILTNGSLNLTGVDLAAYAEAIGLRVAARFFLAPGENPIAAKLTTVKVGPVSETYSDPGQTTFVQDCRAQAAAVMRQIGCVETAVAPRVAFAGRRRAQGVPRFCDPDADLDQAFGE